MPKSPTLKSIFRQQVAAIETSGRDFERNVHRARLLCKRLRAALKIVSPHLTRKRREGLKSRMKAIAKSLAGNRDLTVIGKELDCDLKGLMAPRDPLREKWILRQAQRRLQGIVRDLPTVDPVKMRGLIDRAVRKSAAETLCDYKRARDRRRARDFHRWRTTLKTLLHQIEIRSALFHVATEAHDEIDALQKALGKAHDLTIAREYLRSNDPPVEERKKLKAQLARERCVCEKCALKAGKSMRKSLRAMTR